MVGFATSFNRELMWILASFVVRPGLQGQGLGKALLAAALHHGRGCLRGMLSASADPRAIRRYRAAGFSLHPQMYLTGTVDRSAIPVVEKVRDGSAADFELMDSLDRRLRGAAHGPDHPLLLGMFRLVVSDTSTGSGYAYHAADGTPALLAATNRRTAARLLWECLAATDGRALGAARHGRQRVGDRRGAGGPARPRAGGLPRAARTCARRRRTCTTAPSSDRFRDGSTLSA